jgi:RsiW-degrading membrane proteinase PrsW (M82 family)
LAAAIAFLPVVLFLIVLDRCDSFKLVPATTFAGALAAGAGAACLAWTLHVWLIRGLGIDPMLVSRHVAPVTEETLKALCVLWALSRRKIGFLVDAAIVGFTIGAGFALVENVEYLTTLADRSIWLWVARGFGTAMLHAATAAIIAVGAKAIVDQRVGGRMVSLALPLALAVVIHAIYNRAVESALLVAASCLAVLPLIVIVVFDRSERATREWIGAGLDLDVELLHLATSGAFSGTRLGRYLVELQARFPGPIVADMYCLLQVDLTLAIRAKGLLLARDAGLDPPADETLRDLIAERACLRRHIGPTGLVALRPLHISGEQDDWNEYLLEHASRARRRKRAS